MGVSCAAVCLVAAVCAFVLLVALWWFLLGLCFLFVCRTEIFLPLGSPLVDVRMGFHVGTGVGWGVAEG